MPDLKCTVQTCVHNYKFLCDGHEWNGASAGSHDRNS